MSKRLRVGLVGCGNFGAGLGRYILEGADLVALGDAEASRCHQTAKKLGLDAAVYTDYRAMFSSERLDAVFVTAANFVHAEITIAAAQHGLHVYCEKIMARNVPECWSMVNACRKNKVKLMVGHKRRLRPSWARMVELTRPGGPLGEPLAITIVQYADMRPYGYPGTWWADSSLSGGSQAVLCPHPIDWIRAMCGDAASVSALAGPQMVAGNPQPDILHAAYRFRSGALATINSSFEYPLQFFREAQGPMVQCRHGGLKLAPQMTHIDLRWRRLNDSEARQERFELEADFDTAFRREVGDFLAWITEDAPPCLTWREGLRCVELMEAADRSALAGGVPVELPLYPGLEAP
jgi:UDP-N-acetylglucosamine 3-dehydrogenase